MKKTLLITFALVLTSWISFAQNVNIPDANFKAYLVGNSSINTNSDSEIQVSEAAAFTGTIGCQNQNISDLTGIEAFTSVTQLNCTNNNLTSINVSQNTALQALQCANNNLTSIDITQNTGLTNFVCVGNSITSLDLSQNINLYLLSVVDNNLTSLDLSQNTNLGIFICSNNSLADLDISNNTVLNNFNCSGNSLTALNMTNISTGVLTAFDATNNPNLTCIEVDDVADATANWTNIDATASYSLDCSIYVTSITVQGQAGESTITTEGGTLQMEATVLPSNADDGSYTWSVTNGTGSASINANGLLTALTDGTVTVVATANDGSGITGDAVITISNQNPLSISESEFAKNISIYPNPAKWQIYINSDEIIESIDIIDALGKTIKSNMPSNTTIDVSSLSNGIYLLQFSTVKGIAIKKFIKD